MKFRSLVVIGTLAAAGLADAALAGQAPATIHAVGKTSLTGPAARSAPQEVGLEFRQGPEEEMGFIKNVTGTVKPARVPSSHVPTPAGLALSTTSGAAAGFAGLNHRDQRLADDGNAFSSEPPDQCLAVGNGFVLEGVNSAFRVRSPAGSSLTPIVSMNTFFGLAPAIIRSTPPVFGPFTSDPKCLFDTFAQRWFVTMLVIDTDPATGDFLTNSSVRIAVSDSADPTGSFTLFAIDTTNATGTPGHAGCPCFGDQPLIGADANGFYVTTNEFPIASAGFNGAQIYALQKSALIAGLPGNGVLFSGLPLAEGPAYSVQPASVPPGGAFASENGGTQYFLSALDFFGTLDNRIAVWALTNTSSLNSPNPAVALQSKVLDSQVYGMPPAAQQKPGPTPLGDAIAAGTILGIKTGKQHLPLLESNDDRMQQTVFAAGRLWSSLTTVIKTVNGPVRSGAAWFAVEPSWSQGQLGGSVADQGYVSVNGKSVLFPAIGVNAAGGAVMGFTLVGTDLYPSAAYTVLGSGIVNIAAAGTGPDDGLTGYPIIAGTNAGRWGDYSAAVADENGDIWFATEYIPGGPRTTLANWGTFIAKVHP